MGFDPDELPFVMLFRGKTFNALTRHIIDREMVPSEWVRANFFHEELDVSSTAFQQAQDQAVAYGLLARSASAEEAPMPRFKIPDSPTVQLLRSFHTDYNPNEDPTVSESVESVYLPDLMESNGRARLIAWFLAASDPDQQYSKGKTADVAPVGRTTISNHIETLVEYGIVTAEETSRGSQTYDVYQFNTESTIAGVLYDLNETVANQRRKYNEQ